MRSTDKIQHLFRIHNGRCIYCEQATWIVHVPVPLDVLPTHKNRGTIEHVIPVSRGGSNRSTNLTLSCMDCNKTRAHLPHEVFAKLRKHPHWRLLVLAYRRDVSFYEWLLSSKRLRRRQVAEDKVVRRQLLEEFYHLYQMQQLYQSYR